MPHEIDTIVLTTQFLNNSDYSLNKDLELERSTFDENSIFKSSLDLFDKLTCTEEEYEKPLGHKQRTLNLRNLLVEKIKDKELIKLLNSLDVYTVEVLVIYALGRVFNDFSRNSPKVKASTLIEKLG